MKKKKNRSEKMGLVVGLFPEQYKISDSRLNKPVCHQKYENGNLVGSMLLQEIDITKVENKELSYFSPNNIGLLLSINSNFTEKAERLFNENFMNQEKTLSFQDTDEDKKILLNRISKKVCDFIEAIQISIVFGYTALETFANLSIPEGHSYKIDNKSKGIKEVYDKNAMERWLNLRTKFQYVLKEIYGTGKVESQKWWGDFSNLEQLRNDIIHQKSINKTDFYKNYFKKSIFKICSCPKQVIKFFYESHAEKNQTNPIWPWLINEMNYFPISKEFDSNNFEVIGNIYGGIKRKEY
ncbi:MAG: hypothetical protein E3J56_02240 [Candidatus Aminicenantes bacterium]|nr:MAG: hypothetical protein E3J56_02240 [Candidatus Aminicenantes bacterium]